jgi:methanogenic corrinoid protein MtbC1
VREVTHVGFQQPAPRGRTPPVWGDERGGADGAHVAGESAASRNLGFIPSTGPDRASKLADVGKRALEHASSSRFLSGGAGRALLPGAVFVAAAVIALITSSTIVTVVCVLLLLAVATLVGWFIGDTHRSELEDEIEDRSSELRRALTELEIAQAETVRRLSMAVEFRDEDTGAHIERIGRFSTLLAEQMGMDPDFNTCMSHAAPLHDVGKVAIPDAILLKPGPLTVEERAIVETHAEEGHRLLRGSSSSILDMAATIALSHHEKWNGTGYPRGLKGEDIPIEGRIVAIADVFDALTSDRVYRPAFSVEKAVEMMREQRALHFDPVLLDAFLEVLGSSGPDARAGLRSDPHALVERAREAYSLALERGDAESAEGTIATAIDDGIAPVTLHAEVIVPALRHIGELGEAEEIDVETEHLATGITRRVLATLYRYMLRGAEPTREHVLVAGVEGDEHTLGLQMVHDQLAAAGFQTTLHTDLSAARLGTLIESHTPQLIVLGATEPAADEALGALIEALRESHPATPLLVGGAAMGTLAGELRSDDEKVRVLESIEESVPAVEELLAAREPALG